MSDVLDILEAERPPTPEVSKDSIFCGTKKKKKVSGTFKRPEGMPREVYNLLSSDKNDDTALFLTDNEKAYRTNKAQLGAKRVRSWKWTQFTNPARRDGAVFYHWQREDDEEKEYPFAKLNKTVPVPVYSDDEYVQHLQIDGWSRKETDHLFDLCRRFDLRFVVIQDRWDCNSFHTRSVEDIKDHYYKLCNILAEVRAVGGIKPNTFSYDANYERKRKEQLIKLWDRTPEQLEEEEELLNELRKIEIRKKREKKNPDLQKLITATDCGPSEPKTMVKKRSKKKLPQQKNENVNNDVDSGGIKFNDFRGSCVSLRSQKFRLPISVGRKKAMAIDDKLKELNIRRNPIPTEEVCAYFNELRSDIVLLNELKSVLANFEFELQSLKHQSEIQLLENAKETHASASSSVPNITKKNSDY